jgi:hypothetical protein
MGSPSLEQFDPHACHPGSHTKPQPDVVHVDVEFDGVGQEVHDDPHVSGDSELTHDPPQS